MYRRKCLFTAMFTFLYSFCTLRRWKKGGKNSNSSCAYNSISYFTCFVKWAFSVLSLNTKSWCAGVSIDFLNWFCCFLFAFCKGGEGRGLHVFTYLKSFFFLWLFPGSSGSESNLCSCLRLAYFSYHQ